LQYRTLNTSMISLFNLSINAALSLMIYAV
jgi:hypothetical protein